MQRSLLASLIKYPKSARQLSQHGWNTILQQAYATGLVARLRFLLRREGLENIIPKPLRWHFESADKVAEAHRSDILNEIKRVQKVLSMNDIDPVFLKGAAYICCQDTAFHGRLFNDLDIFITKNQLHAAEQLLTWSGWEFEELNSYDEKYYRRWMHEIPPMVNKQTGITLDVHHNLLPLTSRIQLNPSTLLSNIVHTSNFQAHCLAPEDRVLHSAAHLLLGGEFDNGFRDISDIQLIIEQHSKTISFWDALLERSKLLGLSKVLYLCISELSIILGYKVPKDFLIKTMETARYPVIPFFIIRTCFSLTLQPSHPTCNSKWRSLAEFILFIRSHWLRMPLHILAPHLIRKFIRGLLDKQKTEK